MERSQGKRSSHARGCVMAVMCALVITFYAWKGTIKVKEVGAGCLASVRLLLKSSCCRRSWQELVCTGTGQAQESEHHLPG